MTFSWNSTLSSVISGISKAFVLMGTDLVVAVLLQHSDLQYNAWASIAISNTLGLVELFPTSNRNSSALFQILPSCCCRTLVSALSKMVRFDAPLNVAGGSLILQVYQMHLGYE